MNNIHLRGLDNQLIQRLKQTAADQNTSVNTLVLKILKQNLGLTQQYKTTTYHDLDKLAGTWTSREAKEFMSKISDFEQIDEELWK